MAKLVRLKVISSGKVSLMNESAAQRFNTANPKEYQILEEPRVDVLNFPKFPVTDQAEKKSVVVAEVEDNTVEEKRKPGRPKQNP